MFHFSGPKWAVLVTLGGALLANAQQPAATVAPASAAAAVRAPASTAVGSDLTYRSTLEGYQPFADEKRASWREANDNVGRIGGWRAYANEAQGTATTPGGHGGHGGTPTPAAPSRAASSPPGPAAAPATNAPRQPPAAGPGSHSGHGKQ